MFPSSASRLFSYFFQTKSWNTRDFREFRRTLRSQLKRFNISPRFSSFFLLLRPLRPPHLSAIDVIILWNSRLLHLGLAQSFTTASIYPYPKHAGNVCTRNIRRNKGRRISGRMTNVPIVSASQLVYGDLVNVSFRSVSAKSCEFVQGN